MTFGMVTLLHSVVSQPQCPYKLDDPSKQRNGGDFTGLHMVLPFDQLADCVQICCHNPRCAAFSYNDPQPLDYGPCKVGSRCCMLKSSVPKLINNTYGKAVRTGVVHHPPTPTPVFPYPDYPNSTFAHCRVDYQNGTMMAGVQGDTWPSVWAGDGSHYAAGCDNQPPNQPYAYANFWKVSGKPLINASAEIDPSSGDHGVTLSLVNNAPVNKSVMDAVCSHWFPTGYGNYKTAGVIEFDGVLYLAVQCMTYYDRASISFPGRQRNWNAWIITSGDGGITWNTNATSIDFFTGRLTNPMFIQAGQGYTQAPDPKYIYTHFPCAGAEDSSTQVAYWDGNDEILLGRVPKGEILDRSAWEFFQKKGVWVKSESEALPVFKYKHMVGQDHTFYYPPLKRYILPNYGFLDPTTFTPVGWHELFSKYYSIPTAQLTLYESPSPWGPWSLLHLHNRWELGPARHGAYCPDFPAAWATNDGRKNLNTLWMVSSACCGQPSYSYHMTQVTITLIG